MLVIPEVALLGLGFSVWAGWWLMGVCLPPPPASRHQQLESEIARLKQQLDSSRDRDAPHAWREFEKGYYSWPKLRPVENELGGD